MIMIERFKQIYDRLCDDKSRTIFEKRLMYSLTGDNAYVLSLGREYESQVLNSGEWRSFYEKMVSCGDKIALYSAGYWGKELLMHTRDIPWKYVVDKNPKSDNLFGVPMISFEEFVSVKNINDFSIVVSSRVYFEEIRDDLISIGIPESKIIDGAVLFDLSEGKQYFDLPELPHSTEKEVFADIGCYDGLSTVYFNNWCSGNGFSYCFEPDKANIERIHRVLKNKKVDSYKLVDKGVWIKTGYIGFVSTGNSVSHVSENVGDADKVEVVTLDEALNDKVVTFIKMDIEGSEMEALKGAERIISEQTPKLAICVYHKPQDIWEIPELVLKINDSYKFYLRHYSYKDNETVLYAF